MLEILLYGSARECKIPEEALQKPLTENKISFIFSIYYYVLSSS